MIKTKKINKITAQMEQSTILDYLCSELEFGDPRVIVIVDVDVRIDWHAYSMKSLVYNGHYYGITALSAITQNPPAMLRLRSSIVEFRLNSDLSEIKKIKDAV